jgi:outer membrane protein
MKKTIIFLLCIISMSAAKAQTAAGNMMAGGSFKYTSYSYNGGDNKRNTIVFSPSFGYFISDNLAIGGEIGLESTTEDVGAENLKSSLFGIGPFVRYYKFTGNEKFAFFGQAGFAYAAGKRELAGGGDVKRSVFAFDVSPGFSYFFTEHWALDFSLSLLTIQSEDPNKDADDDNVTSVLFGVDTFSPSLGFRYHFGN